MSKHQHTPGPWTLQLHTCDTIDQMDGRDDWTIRGADGSVVCTEGGRHSAEVTQANVALILAAPDLLAHRDMEIERLQKLLNLQQQSYEREIALEVAAERERLRALVQAVRDANAADSAPRMLTARQEAAWVALMDGLDGSSAEARR